MQGKTQFERNAEPLFVRVEYGASAQVVEHERAGVDVIVVVVLAFALAIDGVGHACPLRPVACPFRPSGHAADVPSAGDVAHSASEAYGIGAHHTVLRAFVAEHHHAVIVHSGIELEGA